MKAITVEPKKPGSTRLEDVPEPDAHYCSVFVEAITVGVCGTNVEIAEGKYGCAPQARHASCWVMNPSTSYSTRVKHADLEWRSGGGHRSPGTRSASSVSIRIEGVGDTEGVEQ